MHGESRGRTLQIGVMGSCNDLHDVAELKVLAEQLGREIARQGHILLYGAEKDFDSLSTAASRGAKEEGGLTVGFTYGKGHEVVESGTVTVVTGLERGGGREFSLVLSCHGIITVAGGSGTLNEMVIAYQAGIPVVALRQTGGWSERLADEYLDERRRLLVVGADDAEEAVRLIVQAVRAGHA